jgi:hypothetical protein
MIVRDLKRLALLVGPLTILLLLTASLWHSRRPGSLTSGVGDLLGKNAKSAHSSVGIHRKPRLTANESHYEILSASSADGKYYEIRFGRDVYNPSVIPHTKFNNTWHIVGQPWVDPDATEDRLVRVEVGCLAQFLGGTLMCIDYLKRLPIEPTKGTKCEGRLALLNMFQGPHDARVFYGPQSPMTTYGSNSANSCIGQFIQDFRKLVDWEFEFMTNDDFPVGTEIVRPQPFAQLEKNYFVFWDNYGQMHIHYDMYPKRGYSKLERDGSTGPNLANTTAAQDEKCLQRYMPESKLDPKGDESIHQATNSLKITLCNRADEDCEPHAGNTYIMAIIQKKSFFNYHAEYEPYVVLFKEHSPFELHAISRKPIWISGRRHREGTATDMMYVSSMNWKERGVKYHGYLDDVLFLGFGFEDKGSGTVDVLAEDLLVDMGLCDKPEP